MKKIFILILISIAIQAAYIPRKSPFSLNYSLNKEELIAVRFWEKVFAQVSSHEIIVMDSKYYMIYEIVKIPKIRNPKLAYHEIVKIRKKVSRKYKAKYRNTLFSIYNKLKKKKALSFKEKVLYTKFKRIPGDHKKFYKAMWRLRTQPGQKDEIHKAYKRAKPYISKIEKIFHKHRIPWELTRIPVIESMFQKHARSAAGAVGIWQLLKGTAKRYLKFSPPHDPRKDPIKATYAAVRVLKHNFRSLKSWPLTTLSYNIGRYGTLRAIKKTGSKHISKIVKSHKHRTFGFSARNYFYELLAIINIEKNSPAYFDEPLT